MKPASLQMELDRTAAVAQSKIANEHFQMTHAEYHRLLTEREELKRKLNELIAKSKDNTVQINEAHQNLSDAKAVCDEVHARLTALPVLPAKPKADAEKDAAGIAVDAQHVPQTDQAIAAAEVGFRGITASKISNPLI